MKDNKAYEFARWAEATTPCSQLRFSDLAIHPSVPREPESAFQKPMVEPIATLFTVPSDFNFQDPACKGIDYICWPTVAASSIEHYQSKGKGIPGWDRVLLVTTLKRGSLYVVASEARTERPRPGTFRVTSSPKTVFATRPSAPTERPSTSPPIPEDWLEALARRRHHDGCRIRGRSSPLLMTARARVDDG